MQLKEILKNPIVVIAVFFMLLFAYSLYGPHLPISVTTQLKGEPFVVQGEGKVTVVPDIARISLTIEETGASLSKVQSSVNTKSRELTASLKSAGVEEKDIKTVSYNVYPEYDYSARPARITGYRVSTGYSVKIRNFEKVNDVISLSTANGANMVGNISFEVNEETRLKLLDESRQLAVKEARTKAQSLASASGIVLGRIINVSESSGNYPEPFYPARGLGVLDEAKDALPTADIQPGETEIITLVSVSWEVR